MHTYSYFTALYWAMITDIFCCIDLVQQSYSGILQKVFETLTDHNMRCFCVHACSKFSSTFHSIFFP
uniref:Uncharacterized protein n=1 Tax=Rhizophora mucronata TaxID=61149 RepID=A0A2P2JSG9_RHIMU